MIHRIGAVMYAIWGALHVSAAMTVYQLAESVDPGVVQGRLFQSAWKLLFLGLAEIRVALLFNWRI